MGHEHKAHMPKWLKSKSGGAPPCFELETNTDAGSVQSYRVEQ
jgi:hypothetical protein